MAPDKIYYHKGSLRTPYANEHRFDDSDVEYISKDALLEWAMKKKKRLGKMFDAMPATAIGAKLDACKEFIDKIESL